MGWLKRIPEYVKEQAKLGKNVDVMVINTTFMMADIFLNREGIMGLGPPIKQKIYNEVSGCYHEGSCRFEKSLKSVCVNPTLLDTKSNEWESETTTPFEGYLPMANGEMVTSGEGILIRSCSEILKNLVLSYRSRMQTTKIVFHWEEAIEFCYSDANKFDVIHCSNFVSSVGLANLILACSQKLSANPKAILYTEIRTDSEHSPYKIVEKSLCAPLAMIPTIYGLRLADRIELNDCSKDLAPWNGYHTKRPENLLWQKVPAFRNIELSSSSVLNRFMNKLYMLCHASSFSELSSVRSVVNQSYYTPLTFRFILDSMNQRLGHNWWVPDIMRQILIAPKFIWARRTFEDWKNGKKINKFTAGINSNFPVLDKDVPLLRLVLSPFCNRDFSGPDVNFIDNFQFEFEHFSKGTEVRTLSFLLSVDHGFSETKKAFLINVLNGEPVLLLGSIGSMRVEEYNLPYPIDQSQSQLLMDPNEEMDMKVESCVESEDEYTLKIAIGSGGIVSGGLYEFFITKSSFTHFSIFLGSEVITHEQAPCLSCHDITVSLIPPRKFKPLSLSFPFPILAKNVQSTFHRNSRRVDLVLKKSLHEPWPRDFHSEKRKLIVDDLVPWKNEDYKSGNPFNSVDFQLVHDVFLENSPLLHSVRAKIGLMMMRDLEHIQNLVYERNDDYYVMKLHRPLLTSPMGNPILLITAIDCHVNRIAKRFPMTEEEELYHCSVFQNVFPLGTPNDTLKAETDEEFQLLRYILRFNATR